MVAVRKYGTSFSNIRYLLLDIFPYLSENETQERLTLRSHGGPWEPR
jgi:hypothetical protein